MKRSRSLRAGTPARCLGPFRKSARHIRLKTRLAQFLSGPGDAAWAKEPAATWEPRPCGTFASDLPCGCGRYCRSGRTRAASRGLCNPNQIGRKESAKNPSRLQIDAPHRAWLCSSPECRFELVIFSNGASGLKAGDDTGLIGMVSLLQKERRLSDRCPNQEKAV